MGLFRRPKLDSKAYDDQLVEIIHDAKYDYEKARLTQNAMFESNVDTRKVLAETARAKQTYFFLLRAARERNMRGRWSTAFERPEK